MSLERAPSNAREVDAGRRTGRRRTRGAPPRSRRRAARAAPFFFFATGFFAAFFASRAGCRAWSWPLGGRRLAAAAPERSRTRVGRSTRSIGRLVHDHEAGHRAGRQAGGGERGERVDVVLGDAADADHLVDDEGPLGAGLRARDDDAALARERQRRARCRRRGRPAATSRTLPIRTASWTTAAKTRGPTWNIRISLVALGHAWPLPGGDRPRARGLDEPGEIEDGDRAVRVPPDRGEELGDAGRLRGRRLEVLARDRDEPLDAPRSPPRPSTGRSGRSRRACSARIGTAACPTSWPMSSTGRTSPRCVNTPGRKDGRGGQARERPEPHHLGHERRLERVAAADEPEAEEPRVGRARLRRGVRAQICSLGSAIRRGIISEPPTGGQAVVSFRARAPLEPGGREVAACGGDEGRS